MTKEDKYAVVVDGEVVDTTATKKEANEVLKSVPDEVEAEVREFDPEHDKVKAKAPTDKMGIPHLR